jgi:O-antigen/teichoic acid export membrane protein
VSDERRVAAREAGVYLYSRTASALVQLAALALTARGYGTEAYGYLIYALTIYYTGLALGSLGLPDVVFYFLGRQPGEGAAIVRRATFLLAAMAVPVVVGVVLFVSGGHGKTDVGPEIPWLILLLALELPAQPGVNLMIATGHARLASGLYVAFALLRALALVVPALLGYSPHVAIVVLALSALVRLLVYAAIVVRYFPGGKGWFDRRELGAMLAYAVPAGIAAVCGVLNASIDKIVVGNLLGQGPLGEYGAATYELPLITLLPYAVAAVMQPRYVRLQHAGQTRELHQLWLVTVAKVTLAVVPLTLLCIALAPELIQLVFGIEYLGAVLPFQIFTVILLHRIAGYGNILQALGQPRAIVGASLLMVGTNAILVYPLIRWLGFPGAALATLVSNLPSWLFILWQVSRRMGVPIRQVMPWRHYLIVLALSSLVGAGVYFGLPLLELGVGLSAAVGASVYLVLVYAGLRLLGRLSAADGDFLLEWLTLRMLRR